MSHDVQHYSDPQDAALALISRAIAATNSRTSWLPRSKMHSGSSMRIGCPRRGTKCLIPGFDGALFSQAWRDSL